MPNVDILAPIAYFVMQHIAGRAQPLPMDTPLSPPALLIGNLLTDTWVVATLLEDGQTYRAVAGPEWCQAVRPTHWAFLGDISEL